MGPEFLLVELNFVENYQVPCYLGWFFNELQSSVLPTIQLNASKFGGQFNCQRNSCSFMLHHLDETQVLNFFGIKYLKTFFVAVFACK